MKKEIKKTLDLDTALEELARKLRPSAELDDDADYATPSGSCNNPASGGPEC